MRVVPRRFSYARTRRRLAARHLRGEGIEIGALHLPLAVPSSARVRYVDRTDLAGLREHYPELAGERLVAPDVVDDGERLATLGDASQDFVVANHFIEHCEDPLATLAAHARVLRPGGVVFMAVPDAREGVDVARPRTPWEHVLRDHREGPQVSRSDHYREWASLVDARLASIPASAVDAHARDMEARRYSIHFHVWEPDGFLALLARARSELGVPLAVAEARPNHHELLVVAVREG